MLNHGYKHGFTLVELLIAIVVIAILAAISVVAFNGIQSRSVATAAASTTSQLAKGVLAFYNLHGRYPGLPALGKPGEVHIEGCIGNIADFPAADGLQAGECAQSFLNYSDPEMISVHEQVSNELSEVMSIPNTRLATVDYPWGNLGTKNRGIAFYANYSLAGEINYHMHFWYLLKGKQSCGAAGFDINNYYSQYDITWCDVFLENGSIVH